MIRKFLRMLLHLKPRERLDIAPRMYAAEYDPHVDSDVAKVFARTHARSPENIPVLLKRYGVETIDELIPLLPSRQRRARPRERFRRWMMRMRGLLPYDPLKTSLRYLIASGRIPEGTLIYRSQYPYEEGGETHGEEARGTSSQDDHEEASDSSSPPLTQKREAGQPASIDR